MAIIGREQPVEGGGGANWLGYQEVYFQDIESKTGKIPNWEADVIWEVSLSRSDLKFPIKLTIAGDYAYDPGGSLKKNMLIRDMYWFFDAIGFGGGIDLRGQFEDGDGNAVSDIIEELKKHIPKATFPQDPNPNLLVFSYNKYNKGRDKCYSRTCPMIVKNTPEGRAQLEEFVQKQQDKGYYLDESNKEGTGSNGGNGKSINSDEEERI